MKIFLFRTIVFWTHTESNITQCWIRHWLLQRELRWLCMCMWMISLIRFLWCWIPYRLLDPALHLSGNTRLIDQLLPVSYWLNYAEKWWSMVEQTCCKGAARVRNHDTLHHMVTLLLIGHTEHQLRSLGVFSSQLLLGHVIFTWRCQFL